MHAMNKREITIQKFGQICDKYAVRNSQEMSIMNIEQQPTLKNKIMLYLLSSYNIKRPMTIKIIQKENKIL